MKLLSNRTKACCEVLMFYICRNTALNTDLHVDRSKIIADACISKDTGRSGKAWYIATAELLYDSYDYPVNPYNNKKF